jgi:hypothetical protein
MKTLYNQIKRFIQYIQAQISKLPELWLLLRAYLQGFIALLRLISMSMAKSPVPLV